MSLERLRLHQLVSPALPVGAFSYAEGLEVLVQTGRLPDAAAVSAWLEAELERGALTLEAAALAPMMALIATGAWRQLADLDGWLLAQREAPELRAQQRQMGGSLQQLLADLGWSTGDPLLRLAWPAAFALAGHALELAPEAVVEAYLYSWCANQISAAVRLVPLGPTAAQRLQLGLGPLILRRSRELLAADPRALWQGGVGAGLAQLGQAALYSRLFRS
ncbi:MAG: urease accessory UreF family protein [Cyanobacteriota bacterium]|nr:urease accessory UreF family protein [Cyanobacteriota bacterium]